MTYTGSPDDLDDLAMPDRWLEVADGVMPFSRERLIEEGRRSADAFEEAMRRFRAVVESAAEAMVAFARVIPMLEARGNVERARRSRHPHRRKHPVIRRRRVR